MLNKFGTAQVWKTVGGITTIIFSLVNFFLFIFIYWPLSENFRYLIAPYGFNFLIFISEILF